MSSAEGSPFEDDEDVLTPEERAEILLVMDILNGIRRPESNISRVNADLARTFLPAQSVEDIEDLVIEYPYEFDD